MKQHFRLSIIATLCSQSFSGFAAEPVSAAQTVMNSADTLAFCQKPTQIDDKDPQAITISAKNATLLKNGEADFSGDVTVCLQDSQLKSDKAQFSRSKRSMSASGQIKYHNEAIDVTSTGLEANIGQSRVKLSNSKYVMTGKVGRGEASLLDIQDKDYLVLNDGTFTTCPIDDDGWLLSAEEITFSRKEGWAEAWNASIRINDTPIIYIPYLTFPLDDRRKSGFLYPKVSSSVKHGVEIITPWYWNISPDLDATLTPRIMTKRGIQLQSEFRYLAQNNEGLVDLELLPQDNERKDLNTRHLVHWQHRSDYDDTLRAFVNFTDVSDDAYLNDLGSKHQDRTDANLNQHFELSYYSHNIDSVLRIQDFKVLGPHPSSYRALPQLAFNNRAPYQYGAFDLNWFGEVSHFASSDAD
ncbi:MAG: LPS-assembly protein, partial [Alteromonadaceae bacterium]